MSENQTGKEAYEAKKADRDKEKANAGTVAKRNNISKSLVRWLIVLAIVGGVGYWFYTLIAEQLPQGEDFSVLYEDQGRPHVPFEHEFTYNSNPPSSGPHYQRPAAPGDYDEPLPDKVMIHNLEHGDIWISYRPDVSADIVERLKDFNATKVIVTPRLENETDIAIAAWTRVDAFDLNETGDLERRVQDFISRYINQGPERIPGAALGHNAYNPETGI